MNPDKMSNGRLNMAVGELVGWKRSPTETAECSVPVMIDGEDAYVNWELPDYAGDLNATYRILPSMTTQQMLRYRNVLIGMCEGMQLRSWTAIDASVRQRAEAVMMAMRGKRS